MVSANLCSCCSKRACAHSVSNRSRYLIKTLHEAVATVYDALYDGYAKRLEAFQYLQEAFVHHH